MPNSALGFRNLLPKVLQSQLTFYSPVVITLIFFNTKNSTFCLRKELILFKKCLTITTDYISKRGLPTVLLTNADNIRCEVGYIWLSIVEHN